MNKKTNKKDHHHPHYQRASQVLALGGLTGLDSRSYLISTQLSALDAFNCICVCIFICICNSIHVLTLLQLNLYLYLCLYLYLYLYMYSYLITAEMLFAPGAFNCILSNCTLASMQLYFKVGLDSHYLITDAARFYAQDAFNCIIFD